MVKEILAQQLKIKEREAEDERAQNEERAQKQEDRKPVERVGKLKPPKKQKSIEADKQKLMHMINAYQNISPATRWVAEPDDSSCVESKLRAPIICVLGHVDTGKTKILDNLRRTNVQDGEAGGITQQIGATNVPQKTIKERTKMCLHKHELRVPGLLIIDTPGHESFSNLRSRGSSLCDIAVLVVDIMHGLEPQTVESINLLKTKKTPFVVALNKIDRLYDWRASPDTDVVSTLKQQKPNTAMEFNSKAKAVIVQFAEQGLNAVLFHENKSPRSYVSLVPTSAHTGDGMGNLITLLCNLAQDILAGQLTFSEELKATVLEVKTIHGLGTTIDVILVNGRLHEKDTIVIAGQEGPIVTQIKTLLMPRPLHESRVKNQYERYGEVMAAQGCKIIARSLEKALAGLPLYVAADPGDVEVYKDSLSQTLKDVLGDIHVSNKGVHVQASTLGSLEALLQFLKTSKIPFSGINIGPVHKKDIMKASMMLEHDPLYAVVLAFDVKVEHEAQTAADCLGVRIFAADIIYHLFDSFVKFRDDFKNQKREELKHLAVFPCKLQIIPQCVFNSRDPIVVGVVVEAGFLKIGTPLCVPSKGFVEIGRVGSIEVNHRAVERASEGQNVCIKVDPILGDPPKMVGRHFEVTDLLVSKIDRQTIDIIKNYFRDEMSKTDWRLIMEFKGVFNIV